MVTNFTTTIERFLTLHMHFAILELSTCWEKSEYLVVIQQFKQQKHKAFSVSNVEKVLSLFCYLFTGICLHMFYLCTSA
jgi:hypothetical protein